MQNNISLIINCKKEDIKEIDMSKFNNIYARIYFNIKQDDKEYLNKILNDIETEYYSIWDYNIEYNNLNNICIFEKYSNIDISILIPVYNCEQTIKNCLDSCIDQDFKGTYEIIIVDDGSEDNTVNIIKSYNNDKIKLYSIEHSGISDALNYGLSKCKGKYICRMDSDDEMYNYRLSYQYAYMETHLNCDILASNINRYFNDKIYKHSPSLELIKNNISINDLFSKKLNYNFICHPAICFKKELYDKVIINEGLFYNSEYNLAEDYELYIRLINKYNITINTDDIFVLKYNVHKMSNDKFNTITYLRNKLFSIYNYDIFKTYTIGIYYIATGIYKNDFKRFLLSVKNFFPDNNKTIVLISDGLKQYDNYIDEINHINIKCIYINDYPWPINTLFKMKYIIDNIVNTDYTFYFNANSEILPIKNYGWFDKDNLIFSYHKDWFQNDCHTYVFCEPFMDNPNSTSYIGTTNYTYIQGAFFGGPTKKVYEMCEEINNMIYIDLQNNIIPRYHDETYLNKYNYLYNNGYNIYISNILISEIWNNINNLSNISDTQFVILHENIYNLSKNNKANKYENIIPFNCLKPLYNYDDIYKYKQNYKSNHILNLYSDNKNLLVFLLQNNDTLKNDINYLYEKYDELNNKFNIVCIFDSRLDRCVISKLFEKFDDKHIFGFDITAILTTIKEIKTNNLYFLCENIINLCILFEYWYNLISDFKFNKVMFINNMDMFKDEYSNLDNYFQNDYDLLVNSFSINNIYDFDFHDYTKQFNLFKFKFKYKSQLFCNIKNCILSYNAYEFLYKFKDESKYSIPQYYIPTLLYNNEFNIEKKNKFII